jgi:hypothetical protein
MAILKNCSTKTCLNKKLLFCCIKSYSSLLPQIYQKIIETCWNVTRPDLSMAHEWVNDAEAGVGRRWRVGGHRDAASTSCPNLPEQRSLGSRHVNAEGLVLTACKRGQDFTSARRRIVYRRSGSKTSIAQFFRQISPWDCRQICRRSLKSRVAQLSCSSSCILVTLKCRDRRQICRQSCGKIGLKNWALLAFWSQITRPPTNLSAVSAFQCDQNARRATWYLSHPAFQRAPTNLSAVSWQNWTKKLG